MKRKTAALALAGSLALLGGSYVLAPVAQAQAGDRGRFLPDESGALVCKDSNCNCGGDPPAPDGCCDTCDPQQT